MDKIIRFTFNETKELRGLSVEELSLKEALMNVLKRNKLFTIGDIIDNWNRLDRFDNLGETKAKNIRAAMHSFLLQNGYVYDHELA